MLMSWPNSVITVCFGNSMIFWVLVSLPDFPSFYYFHFALSLCPAIYWIFVCFEFVVFADDEWTVMMMTMQVILDAMKVQWWWCVAWVIADQREEPNCRWILRIKLMKEVAKQIAVMENRWNLQRDYRLKRRLKRKLVKRWILRFRR